MNTPTSIEVPDSPSNLSEAHSREDLRVIARAVLAIALIVVLGVCYIVRTGDHSAYSRIVTFLAAIPDCTLLQRVHSPRALSSILLLAGAMVELAWGGTLLSQLVGDWVAKAPATIQSIQERFRSFRTPLRNAEETTKKIENLTQAPERFTVVSTQSNLLASLATETPRVLAQIAAALLLIYLFLSSGNTFLRRVVEVVPGLTRKIMMVSIARDVQAEMSRYLVMISIINLGVGVATAISMALLGVPDPLPWGVLARLLNFAPYIGPTITPIGLLIIGLTSSNTLGHALAVSGAFFAIVFVEAQLITPTIIGRRFALDLAVVFVWLLMWGWLWGIPGVLLAGPMIACFKIVCEHVDVLKPTGVLIGNGSSLPSRNAS